MDSFLINQPSVLPEIRKKCQELAFDMASDILTGSLLRSLSSSKPGSQILELGTGIGASLCWMLDGMDQESRITSVDNDPQLIDTARSFFGNDSRVTLLCEDGEKWIASHQGERFDLIFADAWPGKYSFLEETVDLVKPGGFYVVDDMISQPNWPEGHAENALDLLEQLSKRNDLVMTFLDWSTGLVIGTKRSQ